MIWLIAGVMLWSIVHWFPSLMPTQRTALITKWGKAYEGLFSLIIIIALLLIVLGWRSMTPEQLYNPPTWGRHLNMLLMLFALILLGAGHMKSRITQYIRHPMLTAVTIWAVGHLLANGDSRSVILFGGFLIWSVVSQILINRREGAWVKPTNRQPLSRELMLLVASLVLYAILLFLHPYFAGVPVIAMAH